MGASARAHEPSNRESGMRESVKRRLAAGKVCIGAWQLLLSAPLTEVMASLGFAWLALDLEHGGATVADAEVSFMAAERHGVEPFARLVSADPHTARRLLDLGATGLIVSTVEDANAFKQFAQYCLYPHAGGRRGVGLPRCTRWGQ